MPELPKTPSPKKKKKRDRKPCTTMADDAWMEIMQDSPYSSWPFQDNPFLSLTPLSQDAPNLPTLAANGNVSDRPIPESQLNPESGAATIRYKTPPYFEGDSDDTDTSSKDSTPSHRPVGRHRIPASLDDFAEREAQLLNADRESQLSNADRESQLLKEKYLEENRKNGYDQSPSLPRTPGHGYVDPFDIHLLAPRPENSAEKMVREQVERGNNLFQYINSLATLQYETDVVMGRARGTTPHFPRTRRFTMTKRPVILGAPRLQSEVEPEQPPPDTQPQRQQDNGNARPGFVKNPLQFELWRLEREGLIPPENPKPRCDTAAWDQMLCDNYPHLAPSPPDLVFPPPGLQTQEPRAVRNWFREGPVTDVANKAVADDPLGLMTPAQLQQGGGVCMNGDEGGGEKNIYCERPARLEGGGNLLAVSGIDNGVQPEARERKRPLQQPARRSSAVFAALSWGSVEPPTTA